MLQSKNDTVNKQVQRTREWVFGALLFLLDTIPYDELKISSITEKAGVARQTFYRNYKSKDDIIITYMDDLFREYRNRVHNAADKHPSKIYVLMFQLMMEQRNALTKIKNAKLDYLLYEHFYNYNKFFLEKMLQNEADRSSLYDIYSIKYQIGGAATIMLEWIKQDMPLAPEEIGNIVYEASRHFQDQDGYIPNILSKMDK
ncbi:MAG TPA: TetR/AcrR family transcriptional regulator [Mobilitalea sp.]|nr:TetR/AcrR family transcriptional regulator [Mobilitalea sp.]